MCVCVCVCVCVVGEMYMGAASTHVMTSLGRFRDKIGN